MCDELWNVCWYRRRTCWRNGSNGWRGSRREGVYGGIMTDARRCPIGKDFDRSKRCVRLSLTRQSKTKTITRMSIPVCPTAIEISRERRRERNTLRTCMVIDWLCRRNRVETSMSHRITRLPVGFCLGIGFGRETETLWVVVHVFSRSIQVYLETWAQRDDMPFHSVTGADAPKSDFLGIVRHERGHPSMCESMGPSFQRRATLSASHETLEDEPRLS